MPFAACPEVALTAPTSGFPFESGHMTMELWVRHPAGGTWTETAPVPLLSYGDEAGDYRLLGLEPGELVFYVGQSRVCAVPSRS